LRRWQSRELGCDIPVIISNHRDVEKLAAYCGIPFEHIPVVRQLAPRRRLGSSAFSNSTELNS
jgi:formyltetrahydrofolate deformylase